MEEHKTQSKIFHEHAICKSVYSKSNKMLLVLDEDQNHIKLVSQMRLLHRLAPRKDKFAASLFLKVTAFAWGEIENTAMLAIDQGSLVFIRLDKFLQDPALCENQVVSTSFVSSYAVHLEMPNLWLVLSEGSLYRVDPNKGRVEPFDLPDGQPASYFVELTDCNQILASFDNNIFIYNERLSAKLGEIVHTSGIREMQVGRESGDLYVAGDENYITRFRRKDHQASIIPSSKLRVESFEVFESLELIVSVDQEGILRLLDQSENSSNQQISLKHMKKDQGRYCILRTNKNEFIVTKQSIVNY